MIVSLFSHSYLKWKFWYSLWESDWSLSNISYNLLQKNDGDAIEEKATLKFIQLETPELDFEMVLLKRCKHIPIELVQPFIFHCEINDPLIYRRTSSYPRVRISNVSLKF